MANNAQLVIPSMPYFHLLFLLLFDIIKAISCCTPPSQRTPINNGYPITFPSTSLQQAFPKQQDRLMRLMSLIEYTLVTNNCPVASSIIPSQSYTSPQLVSPPTTSANWGELQPQVNALISSAQACQLNISLLQDIVRISMNCLLVRCEKDAIRYNRRWIKDDYYDNLNGGMEDNSWTYNNSNKFNNYNDATWTNNGIKLGYDVNGRIGFYGPLFPIPIPPNNNYNGSNNNNYFNGNINYARYGFPYSNSLEGATNINTLYRKRVRPAKCKNAPMLPPPPPPYT